ncbi:hypothetical protein OG429_09120 [Streptomyces sp. NBC_00190]|uniref:hypothetical protein n=1 Tax=unclassified Streptomyces TaxID=2593676 RepID=UPI002E2D7CD1|nr:hypothetical protein [Streptomyces sp. NBC_00190]WSZ39490.1 hypothetical protein OG239_12120 [Streptomyces sp. NBC_00868]
MNGSRKLAVGITALALTVGGAVAVSSASAEPREAARAAATTTAWAKVAANGQVLGGQGITGINKFGIGRYNITTSSGLNGCALLGTINTNGGNDPGPGSSSILVGQVNGNTLFIRTATPSAGGTAAVDSDRPFSITVVC